MNIWHRVEKEARIALIESSGSGAFCGGADLHEMKKATAEDALELLSQRVFEEISKSTVVSIVAVHGAAVAGDSNSPLPVIYALLVQLLGLPYQKSPKGSSLLRVDVLDSHIYWVHPLPKGSSWVEITSQLCKHTTGDWCTDSLTNRAKKP